MNRLLTLTHSQKKLKVFQRLNHSTNFSNFNFVKLNKHQSFNYLNKYKFVQRRNVFSFTRIIFSVTRLPLFLGVTGASAVGFISYKIEEFKEDYIPEWLKNSVHDTTEYIKNFEFPELPELPTLPELPSFPFFKLPHHDTDPSSTSNFFSDDEENKSNVTARQPPAEQQVTMNKSEGYNGNSQISAPDHELMVLTKKLIEVRNLLKDVNIQNETLKLPSIVVIGSQSSGKSSVLESIVGHEFLPKGKNMVTRRPIELTLIHSPETKEDFGEFPQLGLGKIFDFSHIQKTLTDLNLAVTDEECVSKDPIELFIHSANVPDLTLIDLPGYIQIHNRHQPAELKKKISDLCETYITEPNIILAVCAADVDLANSPALQASRKVDPKGSRTIGVVTKMDLVDPDDGLRILKNKEFPLQLGYVGVSCKPNTSVSLLRRTESLSSVYAKSNVKVGTETLRTTLMQVLESHMGKSLTGIVEAVQAELDDARYHLKVEYNDRRISAESYVAGVLDTLKTKFKEYENSFGKPQVREHLRDMLEKQIFTILDDIYYSNPEEIQQIFKTCTNEKIYWEHKLDLASAALTKSGLGRGSTQLVVDILMKKMEELTNVEPFIHHADARKKILATSNDIIKSKFHTTVDQVENTIKPYKFDVESTEAEWADGLRRAITMLEKKLKESQNEIQEIRGTLGRRKLRQALAHLEKKEKDQKFSPQKLPPATTAEEEELFPKNILLKAKKFLTLNQQQQILQLRISNLKSRQCRKSNKGCCPEAYLSMVSEKLTYTAVMFINVELLSEFFFTMPRELESKLYYGVRGNDVIKFAEENLVVKNHLHSLKRREILEEVMGKLKELNKKI